MTVDELEDFSDAELQARLTQRGFDQNYALHLVKHRDDPDTGDFIARTLDR